MLREWLQEKHDKGVKQVRITSVLEKLAVEDAEHQVALRAASSRRSRARANGGPVTITPDDLLGAQEVAQLLRVDRTRPSKWQINETTFGPDKIPFPEPFKRLATGPVWLRSQITPLIPFVEGRRRGKRDD